MHRSPVEEGNSVANGLGAGHHRKLSVERLQIQLQGSHDVQAIHMPICASHHEDTGPAMPEASLQRMTSPAEAGALAHKHEMQLTSS